MKTPVVEMVAVDKIKDNPYRDKKRNPIAPEAVDQLLKSIEKADFWVGVYGRKVKDEVELAFGHTRLEAAKKAGLKKIPITLQDFTEGEMIMRMALENAVRSSMAITKEAVYAAVTALGAGKIPEFPKPEAKVGKAYLRKAPSFVTGTVSTVDTDTYTVDSLASFLGLVKPSGQAKDSVEAAVKEFEVIERKMADEDTFKGLGVKETNAAVSALKKRHEEVVERRTHTAKELVELHAKRAKIDADRRKEEKRLLEEQDRLAQQEREARAADDERKAKETIEQMKKNHERQQMREAAYAESRKKLDAKVAASEEREREAKDAGKDLPTRYAFKTMLVKLETIVSERNPLREELKSLSRNKAGSSNERELTRQALITAGDWYIEQANAFLPMKPVDVLAEARAKEETKRKLEEGTKETEL